MRRRRSPASAIPAVLVAVSLLVGGGPVHAAVDPAVARRRVVAAIEADLAANPGVPGEVVAVRAPGLDVVVGAGLADVASGTPLEGDTPFRIASVTKTFVAASVLRLVEQRRVRLDAPITRYLSPASIALLRTGGYRPRTITVRQLLRHTAGLFDYAATDEYDEINTTDPGHRWTRDEQLRFAMTHGEPVAQPGAQYHYSDTGYVLLGEILERVTGKSLPEAVRRLIGFHRLKLDHTYWEILEPTPAEAAPRAHQYYDDFDNSTLDASHDLYGGGGLVSTVADVTRFYRALFHGKIFHGGRTLREMTRVARGRAAGRRGDGHLHGRRRWRALLRASRVLGHGRGPLPASRSHDRAHDEPGERLRLRLRTTRTRRGRSCPPGGAPVRVPPC